jgi:hypothetical protein
VFLAVGVCRLNEVKINCNNYLQKEKPPGISWGFMVKGITWRLAVNVCQLTARLNDQWTAISKGTDTLNIAEYNNLCQSVVIWSEGHSRIVD